MYNSYVLVLLQCKQAEHFRLLEFCQFCRCSTTISLRLFIFSWRIATNPSMRGLSYAVIFTSNLSIKANTASLNHRLDSSTTLVATLLASRRPVLIANSQFLPGPFCRIEHFAGFHHWRNLLVFQGASLHFYTACQVLFTFPRKKERAIFLITCSFA